MPEVVRAVDSSSVEMVHTGTNTPGSNSDSIVDCSRAKDRSRANGAPVNVAGVESPIDGLDGGEDIELALGGCSAGDSCRVDTRAE